MPDIMIVGAGIIGVTLALELRERGASVTVLDRSTPGQEASTAAAWNAGGGGSGNACCHCVSSRWKVRALYPAFVAKLEALQGLARTFAVKGRLFFLRSAIN